jgi:hypothetical protein
MPGVPIADGLLFWRRYQSAPRPGARSRTTRVSHNRQDPKICRFTLIGLRTSLSWRLEHHEEEHA